MQVESGRWLLSCSECEICFAPDDSDYSVEDSFRRLENLYEEGALVNNGKTWIRRHGLGKELNVLDSGVDEEFDLEELPPEGKSIVRGQDEIVKYEYMGATEPELGSKIEELGFDERIISNLKSKGISRLFEFQEETIDNIQEGEDVVISAPTATGKTEAFILPIFQNILESEPRRSDVRALLIYPTKTLSRDQLEKLKNLATDTDVKISVYDGDTNRSKRSEIENNPPDILITNFDMIHYHLSRDTNFSDLVRTAEYVVIDENHQYTGAFGSNVRFIIERMRRRFMNDFQLIGASATIRNPKEFGESLFGSDVKVITCDQGRHGPIHFFMLYPENRSTKTMLVDVLQKTLRSGKKTVLFGNSHKGVESMKMIAEDRGGIDAEVHRAGLSHQHRRSVIRRLRDGGLESVIATPTLELGIDIGNLDAILSVLVGITSLKQRMGRVARRGQEGIAVLGLRNDDPISSYYRNHPDDYFKDIDPAYCEPKNPVVAKNQLICGAMDRSIDESEFLDFENVLEELEESNFLRKENGKYRPTSEGREKVKGYSIRGIGKTVHIWHDGNRIGSRQMPIAARELHPGAVYLHGGNKYRSLSFTFGGDSGSSEVKRLPSDRKKRTEAKRSSNPQILKVLDTRSVFNMEIKYCKLRMSEIVDGYYVIDVFQDKVIEENWLENPIKYSFETLGIVFKAPLPKLPENIDETNGDKLSGTFHAIEHSILDTSDMLTGGGSEEVGGVAMGETGIIFAYDGSPGGSGICRLLYNRFEKAVKRAQSILEECKCDNLEGCPNCTFAYRCGNNNDPLNRQGAMESLEKIISGKETKIPEKDYSTLESIV